MFLPHQALLDNLQALENLAREEGLAAPGNRLQRYHFLIEGLLAASQEPDPDAFPCKHGHARVMWGLTEATELLGAAAVLRAYPPDQRRIKLQAILAGPRPAPRKLIHGGCEFSIDLGKESSGERQASNGRADHRGFEGIRGRSCDERAMPAAGHQRADFLPLEREVRRDGSQRRQEASCARG